jgi:hypothetical protein
MLDFKLRYDNDRTATYNNLEFQLPGTISAYLGFSPQQSRQT